MQKEEIEKLVAETMNAFDGAKRAAPQPFLLTRIFARMDRNEITSNAWYRVGVLISKPGIAFAGLVLVIVMNVIVLVERTGQNAGQSNNAGKEEINNSFVSVYEVENQEL